MRIVLLAGVVACSRPIATPDPTPDPLAPRAHPDAVASQIERAPVVAPALGARELIEAAGVATFLEDHALRPAKIDGAAMERWFARKPSGVFLYTERAIETGVPEATVRGRCQWAPREPSPVLNALEVVVWRRGDQRTLLELGQESVSVRDDGRERGAWEIRGGRRIPMGAVAWDDTKIQYSEGAEIHEVACVLALRTVPCGEGALAHQHGSCVDRELVVRPWRAPTVLHVGGEIPAYPDLTPDIPVGDCEVTCAPSACKEALRLQPIPWVALYTEPAPVLAAFRTQAACRAFASSRKPVSDGEPW